MNSKQLTNGLRQLDVCKDSWPQNSTAIITVIVIAAAVIISVVVFIIVKECSRKLGQSQP